MTKNFRKKLKSSAGASITFALLLFLVCAVVGSVVLAAGTAASGRFSKLAETDRRRGSVNSAAELICGMIDGKSVTTTAVSTDEFTETVSYNADGSVSGRSTSEHVITPAAGSPAVSGEEFFLLRNVASGLGTADSVTLDLTHTPASGSDVDGGSLKVTAKTEIDASGNLSVTVTGDKYSVKLKFEARKATSKSSSTAESTPVISGNPNSGSSYSVATKKTTTVTETTSLTWTLVGSERVVSEG